MQIPPPPLYSPTSRRTSRRASTPRSGPPTCRPTRQPFWPLLTASSSSTSGAWCPISVSPSRLIWVSATSAPSRSTKTRSSTTSLSTGAWRTTTGSPPRKRTTTAGSTSPASPPTRRSSSRRTTQGTPVRAPRPPGSSIAPSMIRAARRTRPSGSLWRSVWRSRSRAHPPTSCQPVVRIFPRHPHGNAPYIVLGQDRLKTVGRWEKGALASRTPRSHSRTLVSRLARVTLALASSNYTATARRY
mmetsp:Transcript_11024/g.35440  ORF Transcript_11024/g.35440 Transcript_11024/m.35440 type:complete len:244 (-) Transcript_11024:78-809(-)